MWIKTNNFQPTKKLFLVTQHTRTCTSNRTPLLLNKTTEAQEWLKKKDFSHCQIDIPIIIILNIHAIEHHYVARFVNPLTNPLCSGRFIFPSSSQYSFEKITWKGLLLFIQLISFVMCIPNMRGIFMVFFLCRDGQVSFFFCCIIGFSVRYTIYLLFT